MYYVVLFLSVHPPQEVKAPWLVVLTVSSAWHTGGASERGRIHEWCSLNLVPTSVYSSAFKLSLDTTLSGQCQFKIPG